MPTLLRARQLLTFDTPRHVAPDVDRREERLVGLIDDGAVVSDGDAIVWVGPWADRPITGTADADVPVAMPGWIECHTHALFGGRRHDDFARRNAGTSYAEILEAGGGILSTVRATRDTPSDTLAQTLADRLASFHARGLDVVEVKTGYGLSVEHELEHLSIMTQVAASSPVHVVRTNLAGHTIPPEFADRRAAWIHAIVDEILPRAAAADLVDQVDVFCDRGALTVDESRIILEAARRLGLGRRVHAEELAHTGATRLAAQVGATSADHLEHIDADDIAAMASADVAAVLLPLVTVFLDLPHRAPARALADAGVRLAVSTDYNPGSAYSLDLHAALSLACSLHKLTPGEALRGVTRVAAEVLDLDHAFGRLAPGVRSGVIGFDVGSWDELPWHLGTDLRPIRLVEPRPERPQR